MIVFGKLFRIDDVRTLHALDVPWNAVDAHQSVASTDVVNSVARPSQRAPMDQDASGDQLEPKKFYGELEKIDSGKKDKGRCNWDQFAANRKMFNVQSTYKEELYTTKLDVENVAPDVLRKAEKLAGEIESENKGSNRTADGLAIDGKDEEALWAAVNKKNNKANTGAGNSNSGTGKKGSSSGGEQALIRSKGGGGELADDPAILDAGVSVVVKPTPTSSSTPAPPPPPREAAAAAGTTKNTLVGSDKKITEDQSIGCDLDAHSARWSHGRCSSRYMPEEPPKPRQKFHPREFNSEACASFSNNLSLFRLWHGHLPAELTQHTLVWGHKNGPSMLNVVCSKSDVERMKKRLENLAHTPHSQLPPEMQSGLSNEIITHYQMSVEALPEVKSAEESATQNDAQPTLPIEQPTEPVQPEQQGSIKTNRILKEKKGKGQERGQSPPQQNSSAQEQPQQQQNNVQQQQQSAAMQAMQMPGGMNQMMQPQPSMMPFQGANGQFMMVPQMQNEMAPMIQQQQLAMMQQGLQQAMNNQQQGSSPLPQSDQPNQVNNQVDEQGGNGIGNGNFGRGNGHNSGNSGNGTRKTRRAGNVVRTKEKAKGHQKGNNNNQNSQHNNNSQNGQQNNNQQFQNNQPRPPQQQQQQQQNQQNLMQQQTQMQPMMQQMTADGSQVQQQMQPQMMMQNQMQAMQNQMGGQMNGMAAMNGMFQANGMNGMNGMFIMPGQQQQGQQNQMQQQGQQLQPSSPVPPAAVAGPNTNTVQQPNNNGGIQLFPQNNQFQQNNQLKNQVNLGQQQGNQGDKGQQQQQQ